MEFTIKIGESLNLDAVNPGNVPVSRWKWVIESNPIGASLFHTFGDKTEFRNTLGVGTSVVKLTGFLPCGDTVEETITIHTVTTCTLSFKE